MNELVGERLSIITSKAQTTRHRILGIVNGDDFQIVYSDTPGILRPNYKLQESMLKFVNTAFIDADIILYVTDVVEKADKNAEYISRLQKTKVPVLLLINKIDLTTEEKLEALKKVKDGDEPGEWNISVYGQDAAATGASSFNATTFTYNTLYAFQLVESTVSFSASTAGISINASNDPQILNNTGNGDFSFVNLTGFELFDGTSSNQVTSL